MAPFDKLTAVAAPIDLPNIDTDQITPARFLRRPRDEGYADILFHDVRKTQDGAPKPDFVLNTPAFAQAAIPVADRHFRGGPCPHPASWALVDNRLRRLIPHSFVRLLHHNPVTPGLLHN